jgi:hypothetical protein
MTRLVWCTIQIQAHLNRYVEVDGQYTMLVVEQNISYKGILFSVREK